MAAASRASWTRGSWPASRPTGRRRWRGGCVDGDDVVRWFGWRYFFRRLSGSNVGITPTHIHRRRARRSGCGFSSSNSSSTTTTTRARVCDRHVVCIDRGKRAQTKKQKQQRNHKPSILNQLCAFSFHPPSRPGPCLPPQTITDGPGSIFRARSIPVEAFVVPRTPRFWWLLHQSSSRLLFSSIKSHLGHV